MRCNRCGSENKDGSVFCSFCGGKIATGNTSSTVSKPNNTSKKGNDGFTDVFIDRSVNLNDSTTSCNNIGNSSSVQSNNNTVSNGTLNNSNNFSNSNYQNTSISNNMSNNNFNNGFTNTSVSNNQNNNYNNWNNVNSPNNMNSNYGYGQNYSNQNLNINMNSFNNRNNTMKFNKLGLIGACVVAVIVFAVIFDVPSLFSNKRTIMLYMIGSNLESEYGAASLDIDEIKASGMNFDDVNFLIYTGGTKKWLSEEIPDDKNAIFRVTDSGLELVQEYEKSNMTDPNNLTTFLDYAYNNYKSSKYSLILWDHGGGPVYGYGQDENYIGALTLAKLKQGLSNSKFNGKKLEMIGFDACLMSSIEVADALSDYANYMVASQEVEPGYGWDYSFLSDVTSKTSVTDMGESIINYYKEYYTTDYVTKGVTLSLLDLSKVSDVESKINDLFKDLDDNLSIEFSNVSRSRNSAKSFGKVSASSIYDLVDLYDLADKMPSNYSAKIDNLKNDINDFVVYQTTDLENTYGISIYFPYENKEYIDKMISLYKQFDFAEEYTNFISNFANKLTGNSSSNWRLSDNVPEVKNDNIVSVTVPSDVSENYSSANYVIFEKADAGYYIPRFKGTDVSVSGNTFSTTVSKKGLVASDDTDSVYLTVFESEKGKGYVKYYIPSILQNWGESVSDNYEMKSAYIEFVVDDDHPKGYISSVIPMISGDEVFAPKLNYELKDFKSVQLWNFSYKIFDSAGNYTTDWESSSSMNGYEFDLAKKFELEFKDFDSSKEYYVLFHISDSQGNTYTTNAVKIYL